MKSSNSRTRTREKKVFAEKPAALKSLPTGEDPKKAMLADNSESGRGNDQ